MPRSIAERKDILSSLGELFREHGYEGTTLSIITEKTGLGKGSLYHFFPGGKEEMAEAVLDEIGNWFEFNIFTPLLGTHPSPEEISKMFGKVDAYFASGKRICLVGAFAISDTRDRFAARLRDYFLRWMVSLESALRRLGLGKTSVRALSEDIILRIQGALVLARAIDDPGVFRRALEHADQDVQRALALHAHQGDSPKKTKAIKMARKKEL